MTPLDAKLIVAGLLVGALVGMTGMGGGSLMTPILVLLGIPPVKAVGTDLAYAAVTKVFGAWRHHSKANVDYRLALWLAAGSVPASVAGVFVLKKLKEEMGDDLNHLLTLTLGIALILVGVAFALKNAIHAARPAKTAELTTRMKLMAVGIGVVFGFALGLTSVGSGTFFGMAMMLLFGLSAARIVGTDVFHAAILTAAAGGAQAVAGNVQFGTVGFILIGSIPGILIGSHFTNRIPERPMRVALGVTLAVAGTALVFSS